METFFAGTIRNHLQLLSESVGAEGCGNEVADERCRDEAAVLQLKLAAMATILIAGVVGVAIPLVSRKCNEAVNADSGILATARAFAAGVILATGFVHMLRDGEEALTNPCLPSSPWRRFPFSGFMAMLAALATLLIDFLSTQFFERKHHSNAAAAGVPEMTHIEIITETPSGPAGKDIIRVIGMHAAARQHNALHDHGRHHEVGEPSSTVRHMVVSQILELGIVSHSVIIGLSLGVSQSQCTIRPLLTALSFHQFFEGFALGGCISQAQYTNLSAALMSCFFAITTPAGIAVGTGISSVYNANSPRALVVEGLLDSTSAGILIYMALVDLIATDFLSRKFRSDVGLQVATYVALFSGALAMSSLAIWA